MTYRDPDDYPDPRNPTVDQAHADAGRAHQDDLIWRNRPAAYEERYHGCGTYDDGAE